MQNFTVADLVQTTLAAFAFALFLLPPGYLLGLASDGFGFRGRPAPEKILFSVMFSIAVTPILAVLLARYLSYKSTLVIFLLLAAVAISTLIRELPLSPQFFSRIRRSTWILLGMMLAWFVVVQASLADLQLGHHLYVSFVAFDHSVRVPFVEAAARSGVPPLNPFYGLGKVPVLRYFYYWYVVCALPMRLFGLSARGCFNASEFWSGLGLASTVPLFLKYFSGETENLRRKSVIGIALLAVTGLDLLPYAAVCIHYHLLLPDMEWWDPNQVTSWLGSLLWVPHHVAAMTACMAGLLAVSTIDEETPTRPSVWAAVIAGLAFGSAAGLSVYVTFTFAVFAVAWALHMLGQKRLKTFAVYAASGALSLLLSWPFFGDLLSKQVGAGGAGIANSAGEFAFFAIRDHVYSMELLGYLGLHNPLLLNLAKLPVLLLVYLLEFGVFALTLVLHWRRDRHDPAPFSQQRQMAWTMFAVCLLIMSIMKSNSSGSNDLGFRGMLVVQFVLLLWAAPIVHDALFQRDAGTRAVPCARLVKVSLIATLALGAAGTTWQLIALRGYTPLADAGKLARGERFLGSPGFGERTYWLREGFSRINRMTSPSAFVQYNPVRDEVLLMHLYSARQAIVGDAYCGSVFGGDWQKCRDVFPAFAAVFNGPDTVRNWNLDAFCTAFHVNVLVATDADPVWRDPDSWVWRRSSFYSNPLVRAVPCGTPLRLSTR